MADHKFKKGNQFAKGNPNSGSPKIHTKEFIESLIPDLIEWANQPDSIVFNKWISSRGFHQQRCVEFCQASSVFAEVYKQAKLIVAARREELAMQGKIDAGIVKSTMFVYDREYFDHLVNLKKAGQNDSANGTVNVIITERGAAKRVDQDGKPIPTKHKRKAKA